MFDVEYRPRKFAIEQVFDVCLFSTAHIEIKFFDFPRFKHHAVER